MKRIILLSFICCLLAACHHAGRRLDQIENILWNRPDSALAMLQADSALAVSYSTKDFARYSLLLSAALDKNYIDVQSDSVILPAVDYYSSIPGRYRYLSNYYYGIALKNMQNYPSSIVAFEKSGNEAILFGDNLYTGLCERSKAVIFGIMGNNPAAITSHQKAVDYFENVPNQAYLHYAILSLAIDYVNNRNFPEAQRWIERLETVTTDNNLLHQTHVLKAAVLAEEGIDPSGVIELYNSIPEAYLNVIDYGFKAIAYQQVGEKDSADFWLHAGYLLSDNKPTAATLGFMRSKVEAMRHNYLSAYQLVNDAAHIQDSLTRIRLQESVSSAQRDYYSQELRLQQQQAKTKNAQYQSGVAFLLLVIALISTVFILLTRKREEKYREMLACLNSNEDTLLQLIKDNAGLLGSLLSEKLLFLDKLSVEYCNADTEKAKEAIYKQYKTTVRELRDNTRLFEDIEQSMDRYCNGIIRKFKSQFPTIKGDKLRMAILFFTGIPYKTAELLLRGHSAESLKMAKGRFRKMIEESNAEDAQLFLDMLEMKKGGRRPKHDS